jgi:tetratricopeptide (TPR) repeat protein
MNRLRIIYIYLGFLSVSFFQCSSSIDSSRKINEQQGNAEIISSTQIEDSFATGVIIPNIGLKADTIQRFCLYLPKAYNGKIKLPVVFLFDPQGRGHVPLKKYIQLAEQHHFILVGSNNSKNGNLHDKTIKIITDLFADVKNRLQIDETRIYTSGFSGGARVAASAAIYIGGVSAVTGCGAGFPPVKSAIQNKFEFLGICGNQDFNLTELKMLDKALFNSGLNHCLLQFDGKHEWPEIETMNDAFLWFQFSAMRAKTIATNDSLVKVFVSENLKTADNYRDKQDYVAQYNFLNKIISFTDGLSDNEALKKQLAEIAANDGYKKQLAEIEKYDAIEEQEKKMYASAMQQETIDWWKTEIAKLNKSTSDKIQNIVNKRVLAYLSLVAYSSSISSMKFNELIAALRFLELYSLIDPPNPEHAYLLAVCYAHNKDYETALKHLRNAIYKLHYADVLRFSTEVDFKTIREKYKEYEDLLSSCVANSEK